MLFNFNITDFREFDSVVVNDFVPRLWVGETMVLTLTLKSRIAGCFSGLAPSEERFEGKVNTNGSLLNHLRMDFIKSWSGLAKFFGEFLLGVQTNGLFRGFPECLLLVDELIMKPTAFFQNIFQKGLLVSGWVDTIFECFTHTLDYSPKAVVCQVISVKSGGAFIPELKYGAFCAKPLVKTFGALSAGGMFGDGWKGWR